MKYYCAECTAEVELENTHVSEWIKDSGWTKVTKRVSADTTMWVGMLCPDCSGVE